MYIFYHIKVFFFVKTFEKNSKYVQSIDYLLRKIRHDVKGLKRTIRKTT